MSRLILKFLTTVILAALISGCAAPRPWVKPYERDRLADSVMANQNPLDSYYMSHVYENREAARGADGGTGGGCGCN